MQPLAPNKCIGRAARTGSTWYWASRTTYTIFTTTLPCRSAVVGTTRLDSGSTAVYPAPANSNPQMQLAHSYKQQQLILQALCDHTGMIMAITGVSAGKMMSQTQQTPHQVHRAHRVTGHKPGPSPMLRRRGSSVPNVALSGRGADLDARRSGGDAMASGSCAHAYNGCLLSQNTLCRRLDHASVVAE